MGHATFHVGDLTAVIGDNEAHGEHRAGYNGIWSLHHVAGGRSPFVPAYAALNHEHIFDGEHFIPETVFFEPRHSPMTFRKLGEDEAELHQPPTHTFHVESWTRFKLVPPHYIDMTFRFVARQRIYNFGYIGLFWATYIDAPEDKSLYFLGGPEGQEDLWTQLCTQVHNDKSTVRHRDDHLELTFRPGYREALYRHISPLRFRVPFFYGLVDNYLWMVMFDRTEGIRFTHSPSGGGTNMQRRATCPAWDFQFIVPNYQVQKEYGFQARALLRPRCSREEVLQEYRKWAGPSAAAHLHMGATRGV
jgi:hypothetical protein